MSKKEVTVNVDEDLKIESINVNTTIGELSESGTKDLVSVIKMWFDEQEEKRRIS